MLGAASCTLAISRLPRGKKQVARLNHATCMHASQWLICSVRRGISKHRGRLLRRCSARGLTRLEEGSTRHHRSSLPPGIQAACLKDASCSPQACKLHASSSAGLHKGCLEDGCLQAPSKEPYGRLSSEDGCRRLPRSPRGSKTPRGHASRIFEASKLQP